MKQCKSAHVGCVYAFALCLFPISWVAFRISEWVRALVEGFRPAGLTVARLAWFDQIPVAAGSLRRASSLAIDATSTKIQTLLDRRWQVRVGIRDSELSSIAANHAEPADANLFVGAYALGGVLNALS